jgi:hypothetical protein
MTRRLSFAFATIAILLTGGASQADVSWNFIVTDATNLACAPSCSTTPPLPAIGGSLTMSDAAFFRGNISYFYEANYNTNTIDNFGDTDFELDLMSVEMPLDSSILAIPDITGFLFNGRVGMSVSKSGVLSGGITTDTTASFQRFGLRMIPFPAAAASPNARSVDIGN